MPSNANIFRTAGETAFSLAGLACFWAFFRYQNFFMYLYPQDVSVAPFGLPAHGVFLVALTALSLASLARWRTVDRLVGRHPASAFAVACLGSAGAALVLFHQESPLPSGLVWASAVLVASGFLVLLLGWARYLSEGFGTRLLLVLTASYLLSLIVFKNSWLARTGDVAGLVAIALIPAGSGLGLLLAGTLKRTGLNGGGDSADLRFLFAPPIGLFIAFLLAGSAVRGMVDAVLPPSPGRFTLSLPVTAALVAACLAYAIYAHRPPHGEGSAAKRFTMPQFALACWVAFSAMFLSGTVFLALDNASMAGNVIVIARSMLELAFWILLCDLASRRDVPSTPLFLVCGAFVEIASWAISYVAIPLALPPGAVSGNDLDPTLFILITVLALTCAVTLGFGALFIARGRRQALIASDDWMPAPHSAPERLPGTPAYAADDPAQSDDLRTAPTLALLCARGLTEREASVALYFAQGFSLGKVAETLCITKSTAQSHIKGAYRKLGIHTKDELIECLRSMR